MNFTCQYIYKCIRRQLLLSLLVVIAGTMSVTIGNAQEAAGYGYLELPISARAVALGGTSITVVEPEMSLAEQNPALLCPEMAGQASFSYTRYMGDVTMGYAGYAGQFLEVGGWSMGVRFVDFGDFTGYDEQGIKTGNFSVKDISLQAAVGYPVNDRLRIGGQLKALFTTYESYSAFAMGVDIGANYYNEATGTSLSVTATNLGGQFKALYEERAEHLPTQLNVGWSTELQHLPFVVSVTACRLLDWNDDFVTESGTVAHYKDAERVLNHLIFAAEWDATDAFWLGASYNYRHQRSFIGQGGFLRGIALGGGLRYQRFALQAAYASAHAGEGSLTLQLSYTF